LKVVIDWFSVYVKKNWIEQSVKHWSENDNSNNECRWWQETDNVHVLKIFEHRQFYKLRFK